MKKSRTGTMMENNGIGDDEQQQQQQLGQGGQPPLFDNVDITSPDDENDIFESAIQVRESVSSGKQTGAEQFQLVTRLREKKRKNQNRLASLYCGHTSAATPPPPPPWPINWIN